METLIKRILQIGLAAMVMFCCMGGNTFAAENGTTEEIVIEGAIQLDENALPDNEELFAGYVEKVLYSDLYGDISTFGNVGADRLATEESRIVYQLLKEKIEEIAAGAVSSTEIVLNQCLSWTAAELGVSRITSANVSTLAANKYAEVVDLNSIMKYLLMDCPYDLYWYDKTSITYSGYGCTYWSNKLAMDIVVQMPVAEEYLESEESVYQINTELAQSVESVKTKAASIVAENSDASDYEKMLAYKNIICDLTSYNYDVVEDEDAPYGNPWQIIWVFDEDENTKVVCEGYAKAFQYLCDLSNLTCYTVTGTLTHGTGAGPHMWNVVTLDGSNYLVDVTNCEAGTVGYSEKLFLAGTENGTVTGGYIFPSVYNVSYIYDSEQIALLGTENLTLALENYTVKEEEPASKPVTEIFSDVAENEWFVDAVQFVYDKGIIVGDGNVFAPYGSTTRAMVAVILWRMEGSPKVTDYSKYAEFKDLPTEKLWYSEAVAWALNEEVSTGDDYNKLYNPDSSVTREQLALFLWRYASYKKEDVTVDRTAEEILGGTYVNSWAKDGFVWAVDRGIIKGSESIDANGQIQYDLLPQNGATRAQFATVLQRIYANK